MQHKFEVTAEQHVLDHPGHNVSVESVVVDDGWTMIKTECLWQAGGTDECGWWNEDSHRAPAGTNPTNEEGM
jgi:hypothetical protein